MAQRRAVLTIIVTLTLCLSACVDKARLASLLAKVPSDGSAAGQEIAAQIVAFGPDGVKEVCKMLVPPGTGNDAKAQYALSGLAMYVSRPGAEAERKMFSRAVIRVLQKATDDEVKAFLIRTLQLAGKDESVAPLAALLTDDRLCDPAAQALLAIRTPKAVAALVKALPCAPASPRGAQGPRRVTIIRALGELRTKEAVGVLVKDATSEDVNIRRTALYALANIGDPAAAGVLAKAAQAAPLYEKAVATSCLLLFAKRMAEAGNTEPCVAICRDLLKTRTAPEDAHVQCDTLSTLTAALGREALPDLLAATDSPNKEIRAAACELALAIPGDGVTARFVEKMKPASPEARVAIIGMLARRGDKAALPALLAALKDKDQGVRLAAIPASARLGGNDVLPALMEVFRSDQAGDVKAAQEALLRLPGEEVLKAAAVALPKVPPASRAALLGVLAARRAEAQSDAVFDAVKDKDGAVRREAIKALGNVAGERDLPRLVDLLLGVSDSGDQAAAQKSAATAARRIADPERRAEPFLAALRKAAGDRRGPLLKALAQAGGETAIKTLLAEARSADANAQDVAVRALAECSDAAAAPELLKITRTSPNQAHQVLALRGYVRLAGAADLAPEKKVAMLKDALAAAKRPEEKKLALAGLSDVRTVESLKLASSCLEDAALRTETVAAMVKIASPKDRRDKGLSGPEVAAEFKKALKFSQDANLFKLAGLKPPPPPDPANIACGKPVKTSVRAEGTHTPDLAVDGNWQDLQSTWFGANWPCWLQVDLQKPVKIDTVRVFFYWDGARYYQHTVDVSSDGTAWKTVVDASKNTSPSTPSGVLHTFPAVEARYVRVNILKNSANQAVHLVELKVYAEGTAPKPPAPPKPDAEGFLPLFNGKDLTGWTGAVTGYDVKDGVLICDEKRGGYLRTENEYADFIFRFEFKLTPGANNGVAIRTPLNGHAAYDGMEIQIIDNTAKKYEKLQPYQYHGSIYGVVPAKRPFDSAQGRPEPVEGREFLKPVGEWNSEEIMAKGPQITVTLNGTVIVDADLSKIEQPMDHKEHPGLKSPKGFVGFLGHGAHVEFRNIRIKELK